MEGRWELRWQLKEREDQCGLRTECAAAYLEGSKVNV